MKISEKARTLLAEEYERHGKYPTYAQQAMTSDAEFTMCSLRAIERALADALQLPGAGDVEVLLVVRNQSIEGPWRLADKAAFDCAGTLPKYERKELVDRAHVTALQARIAELEADAARYRWLREASHFDTHQHQVFCKTYADGLDAEIDAALSAYEGREGE